MFRQESLLGSLLVLLGACAHHAPRDTSALFPEEVTVIGHRGAAELAPENTAAGFRAAADLGVGFELDVTQAVGGEVVVIHDDTLDRTTTGEGYVDQTPLATIRTLDAGTWYGTDWAGEPVPELRAVLADFGQQVVIDIEIKNPRDSERVGPLAREVVRLVEEAGLVDRVFVTSFNPYVLAAVREANPDIVRGQLYGRFKGADLNFIEKYVLKRLLLNGKAVPDLLVAEAAFLRKGYVRRMRRKGYRVMAWTVNDPEEMRRLVDWGVQGIITDRPDLALEVLGGGASGAGG